MALLESAAAGLGSKGDMMALPRRASNQKWRFCLGEIGFASRKIASKREGKPQD
jgi:hypothetical protein